MESEQLKGRLSGLVNHLRDSDSDNLTLADVASVTEVLIATMDSYFRSIDTSIYRECRALSDYISSARLEIAALTPKDSEQARIPRAGMELDAIVQQTEEATNTIMTAAEEILSSLDDDGATNKDSIEAAVMQIFEACSFQDITGQRISKVVSTLSHIEQRVKDLHDLMGVTDEHIEAAQAGEPEISGHSSDSLAKGPSLAGEGIDQSEVDALMGAGSEEAGQDDIDALMADPGVGADDEVAAEAGTETAKTASGGSQRTGEETRDAEQEGAGEAVEADAADADAADVAAEPADTDIPVAEEDAALDVKGRTTSQEEIDTLFS